MLNQKTIKYFISNNIKDLTNVNEQELLNLIEEVHNQSVKAPKVTLNEIVKKEKEFSTLLANRVQFYNSIVENTERKFQNFYVYSQLRIPKNAILGNIVRPAAVEGGYGETINTDLVNGSKALQPDDVIYFEYQVAEQRTSMSNRPALPFLKTERKGVEARLLWNDPMAVAQMVRAELNAVLSSDLTETTKLNETSFTEASEVYEKAKTVYESKHTSLTKKQESFNKALLKRERRKARKNVKE